MNFHTFFLAKLVNFAPNTEDEITEHLQFFFWRNFVCFCTSVTSAFCAKLLKIPQNFAELRVAQLDKILRNYLIISRYKILYIFQGTHFKAPVVQTSPAAAKAYVV